MTGKQFLFIAFLLIYSPVALSAGSLDTSRESKKILNENSFNKADSSCQNIQYTHKKFRPETVKDLPFPPGAFIEVQKCLDKRAQGNSGGTKEELNRAKIEQEATVRKLSFLLSFIYHQQKNLAGSYKETDRAYEDLTQRSAPIRKGYARAVTNYENALKSYGEYRAYLSALPRAVSDYEKKVGSSFKDFALQKEDGLITMMKTPAFAQYSSSLDSLDIKTEDPLTPGEPSGENNSEGGPAHDKKEARQNLCALVGAFGGATVAEGIVLATLSNPLSAVLGASLGSTLCSENFYEKMTLLPKNFRAKVVDMGAYIKDGLEEIGSGLYNIGKKYLYASPSVASEKISEHFQKSKNWLNQKLGWR